MNLKSTLELLMIVLVMLLSLYPALELTDMIRIYSTTWQDFGDYFQAELIWGIWIPFFAKPILLAIFFYLIG